MGRPRRHLQPTAAALLAAAEAVVEAEGLSALTVRRVADEVGTSTRAVYSTYGSKEGLVVALGQKAFEILDRELRALPTTTDPIADLIDAGLIFRRFAIEHPTLFTIGIQRIDIAPHLSTEMRPAAATAFDELERRFTPLQGHAQLTTHSTRSAARAFHALCEGLASLELRSLLPHGNEEHTWREAVSALLHGLTA